MSVRSLGYLDTANMRMCSGWACYPELPDRVAKVLIYVDGKYTYSVDARIFRSDVKEKKIHPAGLCGFKFEWPSGSVPQVGARIEVRVDGDTKLLNGSPKVIGAASRSTSGSLGVHSGTLPSFYCIGAQKAGTTWLHTILKEHF